MFSEKCKLEPCHISQRRLIATKEIKAGEIIFKSNPIAIAAAKANYCSYCTNPKASSICSKCKAVHYCAKECQRGDWKLHKDLCGRNLSPEQEMLFKVVKNKNHADYSIYESLLAHDIVFDVDTLDSVFDGFDKRQALRHLARFEW